MVERVLGKDEVTSSILVNSSRIFTKPARVAGFVFWVRHMEEHLRDLDVENPEVERVLGWARGEFIVPEDFDEPLPAEIEDSFYH